MERPMSVEVVRFQSVDHIRMSAPTVLDLPAFLDMVADVTGHPDQSRDLMTQFGCMMDAVSQDDSSPGMDLTQTVEVVVWDDAPRFMFEGWESNCYGLLVPAMPSPGGWLYFHRGVPKDLQPPETGATHD